MKFSIITISYNAEKCIESTLKSVLNQTFTDFEYVLVDGNSKDKTNDIIKSYIPEFLNRGISVKYVSEKDEGISDAFNKGIKMSDGDIIAIINSGDVLLPKSLETINNAFINDVDILYGNIVFNDIENNTKYIRKSKNDLKHFKYDMIIWHPATFVRKSVYDQLGLFDKKYKIAMDYDILLRFYNAGKKFKYIDTEFVEMSSGGVSDTNIITSLKECYDAVEKYFNNKFILKVWLKIRFIRAKLSFIKRKFKGVIKFNQ